MAGDDIRVGTGPVAGLVVLSSGDHSKDTGGKLRVGRQGGHAQCGLSEDACAAAVRPAGLFVLALAAEPLADKDQALPWAIKNMLPAGLAGLVFAAFLAAIFSSVDSTLNSAVTIWTRDIYQNFIVKKAPDRHYLNFGRGLTMVFVVLGALLAKPLTTSFEGIYLAMQTLLTFFQGPTLATVLLGIMWARATRWGGLSGLVGGVACSTILHMTGMNFLYVAWWSFVAALIVNALVSIATPPEPLEKLRGLVYGLVMKDEHVQNSLSSRAQGGE